MNPRFTAAVWITTLVTAVALVSGHGGAIVACLVIAVLLYWKGMA